MDILMLIFLFLVCLLLSITVTVLLRNRGPWENPILFFIALFLTSWTILIGTQPLQTEKGSYPYISAASLAILLSLLLAAARSHTGIRKSVKTLDKKKVLDVSTLPDERLQHRIPNTWFWVLISAETLLILSAYYFKIY